jgi:hypothetical protein
MLKIVSCVFSLLFIVSIAVAGDAPTPSSPMSRASASIPQVCSDQKFACTLACHDLSAGSLAACLRICNNEYHDCIAGHQTLTADDAVDPEGCAADTGLAAAALSVSPQICYDQLQACVLRCDRDDGTTDLGCTRECIHDYHQCLRH